jgi:chaperonin GroES
LVRAAFALAGDFTRPPRLPSIAASFEIRIDGEISQALGFCQTGRYGEGMEIIPLTDHVLVKPKAVKGGTTESGIVLPEGDFGDQKRKKRTTIGVVMKLGFHVGKSVDAILIDGKPPLQEGVVIAFGEMSGEYFTVAGEEFVILEEKEILAILKP